MKKLKIVLADSRKYWAHPGLISTIQKRTGWNAGQTQDFLAANETVMFNEETVESGKVLIDELESAGFEIALQMVDNALRIQISVSQNNLLNEVYNQLQRIHEQLSRITADQSDGKQRVSVQNHPLYKKIFSSLEVEERRQFEKQKEEAAPLIESMPRTPPDDSPRMKTTEADIGKYWLSRIGVFTLLLGVVFLITYTSQFLGAWGKLGLSALFGMSLVLAGNYLAGNKEYRKWAMSTIGGGWAIVYFTVYAAYHVPVVKVITNPFIGLLFLLIVSLVSLSQSFLFKSRVMVFMSYLLAYFATGSTVVSYYSLVASLFLGVSVAIITYRLGWDWLALFGLICVYTIHVIWLEPAIYQFSDQGYLISDFYKVLVFPWTGDTWELYPLVNADKSVLHLLFLSLYWLLFSFMVHFRKADLHDRKLVILTALGNHITFILWFIHHLHIYYPQFRWMFTLAMGAVFWKMAKREWDRKELLLSDIYLVFATSLLCLTIPIYFRGTYITYGWSAASASLVWLGLRHERKVMRRVGYYTGVFVLVRLILYDYTDNIPFISFPFPVNPFFFISGFASVCALAIWKIVINNPEKCSKTESVYISRAALTVAAVISVTGFLMGGFRSTASVVIVIWGTWLMLRGIKNEERFLRITSLVFIVIAVIRVVSVDCEYALMAAATDLIVLLRYVGALLTVALLIFIAVKHKAALVSVEERPLFPVFVVVAASLFMTIVSDPEIDFWRSLIWGAAAFLFISFGFRLREKVYRWTGLGMFGCVIGRLFLYDLAQLDVIYRIISFIVLGSVFIAVSFVYNYYSKVLLAGSEPSK